MQDERAVSVAITHALTFGITAILISALLLSAGQYLAAQESAVAENQFSDIGSDVVSHVNSMDRLNRTGTDVSASITPNYPRHVIGETYTIRIAEDDENTFGSEHVIEIESDALDRTLQYPVETDADLEVGASARGESPEICLDDGEISIGTGCA